MSVVGAILAGGASRRMGQPKALLPWRGHTLIQEVADRLQQATPEIVLVTGQPELFRFLSYTMLDDVFPGRGPLGGIHAALTHVGRGWLVMVGCDQPFLSPELVRLLVDRAADGDVAAVVPALADGKIEPLCAAYNTDMLPQLTRWLRDCREPRILHFLRGISVAYLGPDHWAHLGKPELLFFNINTPADLATARQLREQMED